MQDIDGGKDDEADQGNAEGKDNVEGSLAEKVARIRDTEQEDEANGLRNLPTPLAGPSQSAL